MVGYSRWCIEKIITHDFTHHMVYIERKHLRMILKDEMINRTELYHS